MASGAVQLVGTLESLMQNLKYGLGCHKRSSLKCMKSLESRIIRNVNFNHNVISTEEKHLPCSWRRGNRSIAGDWGRFA